MESDLHFWITIIISSIAGGIFGPMLVRYLEQKGWITLSRKTDDSNK